MVWRGEGHTELAFRSSSLIDSGFELFEFPVNRDFTHKSESLASFEKYSPSAPGLPVRMDLVETISSHPFTAQPLQALEFVKAGWKKTTIRRLEENNRGASPKGAGQGNLAQY